MINLLYSFLVLVSKKCIWVTIYLLVFKVILGSFCALFSSAWLCQQSYCHCADVRPSVVRKLRFLRNRCMDPGHILWVAPSPPYLQTIFFFFQIFNFQIFYDFFSFSLTWDPMGAKISNASPPVFIWSEPNYDK